MGYSILLGGSDKDICKGIVVNFYKTVFLTGETFSKNFPTTGDAFSTKNNGAWDMFYTKLNEEGNISYSTYFGGSAKDYANKIVIDGFNNVYIVGTTYSNDFPTSPGAFQNYNKGSCEAFVIKFNENFLLNYSTYLVDQAGKLEMESVLI